MEVTHGEDTASKGAEPPSPFVGEPLLRVDGPSREVHVGGRRINVRLSKQEFDLFLCLYQKAGQTCSREELCDAVWGSVDVGGGSEPKGDEHMLHTVVHRLRGKLARAGVELNQYLTSLAGVGYRLDVTPHAPLGLTGDVGRMEGSRWPARVFAAAGAVLVAGIVLAVVLLAVGSDGDDNGNGGGALAGSPTPVPVAEVCGAEMISPEPGSTLAGSTVTFRWTPGCGMTRYDLWVGCSPGAVDFFNAEDGSFLEATVSGLPTDGGPVFAWLSSSDGTEEGFFRPEYEYTAAGGDGLSVAVVPGDTVWMDTGVDVAPGETAEIEACGYIRASSTGFPIAYPAGDDECPGVYRFGFPVPDLPCWSLVGRLGDGEPFLVGEVTTAATGGTSERLFLGINDDNLVDNDGQYRATIRVAKSP